MAKQDEAEPYPALFKQYKKELKGLYNTLVKERAKVLKRMQDEDKLDEDEALEQYTEEEGPLVHDGRAIALIRKYWLEIDRIKKERRAKGQAFLEPLTFLVEDLEDDDEEELVEFLTEISYWPIGLDENNDWC